MKNSKQLIIKHQLGDEFTKLKTNLSEKYKDFKRDVTGYYNLANNIYDYLSVANQKAQQKFINPVLAKAISKINDTSEENEIARLNEIDRRDAVPANKRLFKRIDPRGYDYLDSKMLIEKLKDDEGYRLDKFKNHNLRFDEYIWGKYRDLTDKEIEEVTGSKIPNEIKLYRSKSMPNSYTNDMYKNDIVNILETDYMHRGENPYGNSDPQLQQMVKSNISRNGINIYGGIIDAKPAFKDPNLSDSRLGRFNMGFVDTNNENYDNEKERNKAKSLNANSYTFMDDTWDTAKYIDWISNPVKLYWRQYYNIGNKIPNYSENLEKLQKEHFDSYKAYVSMQKKYQNLRSKELENKKDYMNALRRYSIAADKVHELEDSNRNSFTQYIPYEDRNLNKPMK